MTLRNALIASLALLFGASPGGLKRFMGGTVVDGNAASGSFGHRQRLLCRDGHRPRRKICSTAESGATLVFSYIGYLRQELTVTNTVST